MHIIITVVAVVVVMPISVVCSLECLQQWNYEPKDRFLVQPHCFFCCCLKCMRMCVRVYVRVYVRACVCRYFGFVFWCTNNKLCFVIRYIARCMFMQYNHRSICQWAFFTHMFCMIFVKLCRKWFCWSWPILCNRLPVTSSFQNIHTHKQSSLSTVLSSLYRFIWHLIDITTNCEGRKTNWTWEIFPRISSHFNDERFSTDKIHLNFMRLQHHLRVVIGMNGALTACVCMP